MLLTSKGSIDELCVNDHFSYFPRPEDDEWKIELLTQMIEERDRGQGKWNFSIICALTDFYIFVHILQLLTILCR